MWNSSLLTSNFFFPNQTSLCHLSPWFIIFLFVLFTAKNSFKCCGSQVINKNCHDWRLFYERVTGAWIVFQERRKKWFFSASVLAEIPTGDFTRTLKISPLIYTPCSDCVIICRPTLFDFLDSPWTVYTVRYLTFFLPAF